MEKIRAVLTFSKIGYVIGCVVLYIFSIWIILAALYSIFEELLKDSFSVYHLLDEVGLIVFSIAVIDVAKYLALEEIIKDKHKRAPKEEREALTRFVIIIATALALEGLVLTIEVAKTNVEKLVYPAILLFASVVFIIGLGLYQKLNSSTD